MRSFEKSRAVIILANDHVATWLTACLNSLRRHSTDILCYIIPYDDRLERVRVIVQRYDAAIVEPPYLEGLQGIAARLCPANPVAQRVFRKLAVFFVGVDEVLFSDADVVFLKPVEEIFDAFAVSGMDLLYADSDITRVYTETSFQRRMVQDYGAKGINTGFWIARGDLFSFEDFQALANQAQALKHCFDPLTMEQPFLNYCLDVTRTHYGHLSRALDGFPRCSWGALEAQDRDGQWFCSEQYNTGSSPLYMLHWAGSGYCWGMANRRIFLDALLLQRGFLSAAGIRLSWYLDHLLVRLRRMLGRTG